MFEGLKVSWPLVGVVISDSRMFEAQQALVVQSVTTCSKNERAFEEIAT